MKSIVTILVFAFSLVGFMNAQEFEMKVKLDNYEEEVLYLGYHYGDKQYLRDSSTSKDASGYFVFKSDTLIDKGMYLVLMAPEKKHFQVLIDDVQRMEITADANQIEKTIVFKGSPQNTLFYDYMAFLGSLRTEVEDLKAQMEAAEGEAEKERIQGLLMDKNKSVRTYQDELVAKNPEYLLSAVVKANWDIETPEFEGTEEEQMYSRFYYIRDHFFKYMDMQDERMIRTPMMYTRVDAFVNKYHAIVPDSAIIAVEKVLQMVKGNEPAWRFFLSHFLNHYSKSKYVGMDAVYVHLVENYYSKGDAPWVDEENLAKIVKEANKLKPILLGKKAPELRMQDRDGKIVSLHATDSDYTVLIFWAPDCGHCKKSMPDVDKFAEKFQSKGVTVFSVCSKLGDVAECWEMIDDKGMVHMVNVVDPKYSTRFKDLYYVSTTPKIYVLDKDKTIVSKNIGTEQLDEILTRFTGELKG